MTDPGHCACAAEIAKARAARKIEARESMLQELNCEVQNEEC